jgi:DNA (cytosine-5)-methyltransferase 1
MAGAPDSAVVAAFLAQFSETREGRKLNVGPFGADEPVSTIVQRGPLQAVCTSNLVKLRGTCQHGQSVDEPLATVSAQGTHIAEVRAFLLKYYGNDQEGHDPEEPLGTVTAKDRFGLVTVTIDGEDYVIVDIGMRMLTRANCSTRRASRPTTSSTTTPKGGRRRRPQVARCGNSVCPPLASWPTSPTPPPRRLKRRERRSPRTRNPSSPGR